MLDVACGPGNLAIGFEPFVGSCVAIDIEPEMLRVARAAAREKNIQFLRLPVEELPDDLGTFDFISVGRALHWLSREAALAAFERATRPEGRVVVCSAAASDVAANEWAKAFREVRAGWAEKHDEARYRPDLEAWFAPAFRQVDCIRVMQRYQFTIDELIACVVVFHYSAGCAWRPASGI